MKTTDANVIDTEPISSERAPRQTSAPTSAGSPADSRPLASSPLIVTLLIVLLAAVFVQGALLVGIYMKGSAQSDNGTVVAAGEKAQLEPLKPGEANTPSGTLSGAGTAAVPSSSAQVAPLGSIATDDFFSDDWQPFAEMARMRERMNRLFNDSFSRFRSLPGFDDDWLNENSVGAAIGDGSIEEKDGNYVVTMEIPGADQATLEVKVENGQLSVEGKREEVHEERDKDGTVISRSQSVGNFQRTFSLPDDADGSGVKSDLKDGKLTVTIPRTTAN
ncbi:MAG: Hsp20/alpha crystallin family protein [Verrucomicrobiae bacterium]|nr:Hsp20/alpha crystallin family protein [Verrucomicrobiae bacterium]